MRFGRRRGDRVMSDRKKRRDMTEYERARDWEDRLSPRWWRAIYVGLGLAGVSYLFGTWLLAVSE